MIRKNGFYSALLVVLVCQLGLLAACHLPVSAPSGMEGASQEAVSSGVVARASSHASFVTESAAAESITGSVLSEQIKERPNGAESEPFADASFPRFEDAKTASLHPEPSSDAIRYYDDDGNMVAFDRLEQSASSVEQSSQLSLPELLSLAQGYAEQFVSLAPYALVDTQEQETDVTFFWYRVLRDIRCKECVIITIGRDGTVQHYVANGIGSFADCEAPAVDEAKVAAQIREQMQQSEQAALPYTELQKHRMWYLMQDGTIALEVRIQIEISSGAAALKSLLVYPN